MVFYCDRCKTKYSISKERWKGDAVKIRCKKCSNLFVIHAPAPKDSPARPPPVDEELWYVGVDGEQAGPLDLEELRRRVRYCPPEAEVYVWQEGFKDWVEPARLSQFQDLYPEPPFNLELEDVGIEDYLESLLPAWALDGGPVKSLWTLAELEADEDEEEEGIGRGEGTSRGGGQAGHSAPRSLLHKRPGSGDPGAAVVPALPQPIRSPRPLRSRARLLLGPWRRTLYWAGAAALLTGGIMAAVFLASKESPPGTEGAAAAVPAIGKQAKDVASQPEKTPASILAKEPPATSPPTIDEILLGLRPEEVQAHPQLKKLVKLRDQLKQYDDQIHKMLKHLREEGAKLSQEEVRRLANDLRALRLRKTKISTEVIRARGALPKELLKRRPPASQPSAAGPASQPASAGAASQPAKTSGGP